MGPRVGSVVGSLRFERPHLSTPVGRLSLTDLLFDYFTLITVLCAFFLLRGGRCNGPKVRYVAHAHPRPTFLRCGWPPLVKWWPPDWQRCHRCIAGRNIEANSMFRCFAHNPETPGFDGVIGRWPNPEGMAAILKLRTFETTLAAMTEGQPSQTASVASTSTVSASVAAQMVNTEVMSATAATRQVVGATAAGVMWPSTVAAASASQLRPAGYEIPLTPAERYGREQRAKRNRKRK